eukprot:Nitzschia sp. Nitz4//scaffold107_size73032//11717//12787//NITZ4_005755-RA/size73032-augustus-gene-0.94-mRNA-1//1//CDS//3329532578//837//frame0
MFQRKNATLLPTSGLSLPTGGMDAGNSGPYGFNSNRTPDGSGRAVKMDAPVVKAWKKASSWTKYTYYILAACVVMVFMGWRGLRSANASIWLTCHAEDCTLELTEPGSRTKSLVFARAQLHAAQAIKTDAAGNFLYLDSAKFDPPSKGKGKKKGTTTYKGPDEKGEYKSYQLKFFAESPKDTEKTEDTIEDGDFSTLERFFTKEKTDDGESDIYVLSMRSFGLKQTRTRVRSNINKVESYLKRRRQKLLIKESGDLPLDGVLMLVFGLLGFMLTLLLGQFWDETPRKQSGPGTRRSVGVKQPTFVVDTGRPSKYPPGYAYQKKY